MKLNITKNIFMCPKTFISSKIKVTSPSLRGSPSGIATEISTWPWKDVVILPISFYVECFVFCYIQPWNIGLFMSIHCSDRFLFWDYGLKFVRSEVVTGSTVPFVYAAEIDETGNIPAK